MPMRTCGYVPSAAAAARLLHYYCCSCCPMRARRPEVAVNSYAGPIARLPTARTYYAAPTGDIVRRVSRDQGVCTRTTAVQSCVVGSNSYAAPAGGGSSARARSKLKFGECLAGFRKLISHPPPTISNAVVAISNSRRRSDFRGLRRRCYNYMYNVYAWSASCAP